MPAIHMNDYKYVDAANDAETLIQSSFIYMKQKSIIFIASKYAILSMISVMSTQLHLLSAVNNVLPFTYQDLAYIIYYNSFL